MRRSVFVRREFQQTPACLLLVDMMNRYDVSVGRVMVVVEVDVIVGAKQVARSEVWEVFHWAIDAQGK